MSGRDLLNCLEGNGSGGVPTFLYDTSLGTVYAGMDVDSIYRNGFDGERSARSISACRRALGHDGVIGSVLCTDGRAIGAEYRYFPDRQPMLVRAAFADPGSLYSHSPEDMEGRSLEECVRSYRSVRRREPDAAIAATIPSPFLVAATARGIEEVMMDIMCSPDYFSDLMRFSVRVTDIVSDAILGDPSADFVVIPGAYDNVDLIGEDDLRRVCVPGLAHTYGICKGYGRDVVFHPHGMFTSDIGRRALDLFIGMGFECIYYGEGNDHAEIAKMCRDRIPLMGGVDSATTIYLGPDDRVRKDTGYVLDSMRENAFIYSCSCSVDRGLDLHRMELMMSVVKGRSHSS
ncbi:MAG: uroporphyrinogen decarboxylase family protein [Candidatus Methanomethylophilaceae archaeon]